MHHYSFGTSARTRSKAFKYLVILCDESTSRKAYDEALKYGYRAKDMASSRTELKLLKSVLDCVLFAVNEKKRNLGDLFSTRMRKGDTTNAVLTGVQDLISAIESKIERVALERRRSSLEASLSFTDASGDKSEVQSRTSKLRSRITTSAKLTWQPSYASKKLNSESKNYCIVS